MGHYHYVSRTIQYFIEQLAQGKIHPCQTEGRIRRKKGEAEGKAHQQEERKVVHVAMPQKVQQERRPACLEREKAQEHSEKREVRQVKEEEAACSVQGKAQQEWKKTSVEKLRIRAEVYYEKGVPEEVQLFELG